MSGGDKREGRQTRRTRNKQQEGDMEENVASTEESGANMLVASIPSWLTALPDMTKQMEALSQEIKQGFQSFKEEVKA
ncbi:unnamed protein product [Knipowitschia caucasica]